MDPLVLEKGRGLVVVAHPDDETIWMGGTILANPRVAWTVFSLCRSGDRDRAPIFKKVCKFLGARAVISDLDDEEVLSLLESLPEVRFRLRSFLFAFQNRGSIRSSGESPAASRSAGRAKLGPSPAELRELLQDNQKTQSATSRQLYGKSGVEFDYVFTHGYNGEYGHPRHRGVNRVVREMVRRGEIKTRALYNFSYEFDERRNLCRPKKADLFLRLSPALFRKKQKIIHEIYGFRKSSFEYKTLSNLEAFKVIK